jgi:hypothetical protein
MLLLLLLLLLLGVTLLRLPRGVVMGFAAGWHRGRERRPQPPPSQLHWRSLRSQRDPQAILHQQPQPQLQPQPQI